jgi:hypothetical protein
MKKRCCGSAASEKRRRSTSFYSKKGLITLSLAFGIIITISTDAFSSSPYQNIPMKKSSTSSIVPRITKTTATFFRLQASSTTTSSNGDDNVVLADSDADVDEDALKEEIRSMRVKEIKEELDVFKVSTGDVFEKEELVSRLVSARLNKQQGRKNQNHDKNNKIGGDDGVIVAPLYFTTLDSINVATSTGDGLRVEPGDQPYATIRVYCESGPSQQFSLNLLLDTACSGFVLRPSVVSKHNLPRLSTPVTMTGAGGTAGSTGLTQINKFALNEDAQATSFGPMPAAVQDIGALPSSLDGIIGLNLLTQFDFVDMDFHTGQIIFYKLGRKETSPSSGETKPVDRAEMQYVSSLGLYTVNVYFDGRGPVKMLVDSGAANTFLNWKGVQDLGVRRDSDILQRLSGNTAAMGSDNISMQLTHRLVVSQKIQIGNLNDQGLSLKDDSAKKKHLNIDIGDIPILEQLRGDNVGGILGIDALMRCSRVRMSFRGANKQIELFD